MSVRQPNRVVDTIPDSKDHTIQGDCDMGPRPTCRDSVVSGHQDVFFDFEAAHPSVDIGEHTGWRSEKAEQHTTGTVGGPCRRCRGGHLRYQGLSVLAHRCETRTQTLDFLTYCSLVDKSLDVLIF